MPKKNRDRLHYSVDGSPLTYCGCPVANVAVASSALYADCRNCIRLLQSRGPDWLPNTGCRICSKCKTEKPLSEFFPRYDKDGRSGKYNPACKACHTASGVQYKRNNFAARKRYAATSQRRRFRNHFGITTEQYYEMLDQQNGACAICQKPETSPGTALGTERAPRMLAVDHDHATGHVRGLTCSDCNRAMGLLHDDASLLRAAADYLDKHRKASQKEVMASQEIEVVSDWRM